MRYLLNCLIAASLAVRVSATPSPITITTTNPIPSDAPPVRTPDPRGPFCYIPGYQSTGVDHVRADIAKLHGLAGDCAAPANGCARVSCTDGGAVWMCNDNGVDSSAPCSVLGDYAQMILDGCPTTHGEVQGQMFDAGPGPGGSGGWGNVVVGLEGRVCD
ncbi:hypothetical protein PG991_003583 [Apiospora marii]|uniref:Uncharacterized protein n=1 Tax=Apiospora marii TaxID=335849 RepID=A0ABR1S3W1_9PEZI